MTFRVVFSPAADRDLVDLWLESEHQREMTTAVDALVLQLQANPESVGESRGGQRRIALQWPVGIRFKVDAQHRRVDIYQLWTFERHAG